MLRRSFLAFGAFWPFHRTVPRPRVLLDRDGWLVIPINGVRVEIKVDRGLLTIAATYSTEEYAYMPLYNELGGDDVVRSLILCPQGPR